MTNGTATVIEMRSMRGSSQGSSQASAQSFDETYAAYYNVPFWNRPIFHWTLVALSFQLLIYSITCTTFYALKPHCNTQSAQDTISQLSLSAQGSSCSDGYTFVKDTGFCYKASVTRVNFTHAHNACEADNAHLASIHNEKENSVVMAVYYDTLADYIETVNYNMTLSFVWIGLTADPVTKVWSWTDGTPFDYTNWANGEPNNMNSEYWVWICDFIRPGYDPDTRMWNNIDNSNKDGAFVCQKSAN